MVAESAAATEEFDLEFLVVVELFKEIGPEPSDSFWSVATQSISLDLAFSDVVEVWNAPLIFVYLVLPIYFSLEVNLPASDVDELLLFRLVTEPLVGVFGLRFVDEFEVDVRSHGCELLVCLSVFRWSSRGC